MTDTPSDKEQAEGSRETVKGDIAGQTDNGPDSGGGITNRPLEEERENQAELPPRGEGKPGAHA